MEGITPPLVATATMPAGSRPPARRAVQQSFNDLRNSSRSLPELTLADTHRLDRCRFEGGAAFDELLARRLTDIAPWKTPMEVVRQTSGARTVRDMVRHQERETDPNDSHLAPIDVPVLLASIDAPGPTPTLRCRSLADYICAALYTGFSVTLGSTSEAMSSWLLPGAAGAIKPAANLPWINRHSGFPRAPVQAGGSRPSLRMAEPIRTATNQSPVLRSAAEWSAAEIRRLSEMQLAQFMGSLPSGEWSTYMRLRNDIRSAAELVTRDYEQMILGWQKAATTRLDALLSKAAGVPIDSTDTWLRTRYFSIKGARHERVAAQGVPEERWQNLPLWTAACTNFPFNVGDGRGDAFSRSSFISFDRGGRRPAPLSVPAFVGAVREVNPGERLKAAIDTLTAPGSATRVHLAALHYMRLRFDILEANRLRTQTGVDDKIRNAVLVNMDFPTGALSWKRFRLEMNGLPLVPGDYPVQLPFFTFNLPGLEGVLSYLHGRPSGAFRFHDTEAAALDQLKKDIDLRAPWLLGSLSIDSRANAEKIRQRVDVPGTRPPGLNQAAKVLYDAVQKIAPEVGWRIVLDSRARRPMIGAGMGFSQRVRLSAPIVDFHVETMKENAKSMATSNADKDWEEIIRGTKAVASEILDILITPVPGQLPGLGGLRTVAFGGLIAYGAASGIRDALMGDMAGLVGASTDALDVAFGIATASSAIRLATKRTSMVRVTMVNGAPGLLLPDLRDYRAASPTLLAGVVADEKGLFNILGERYIAIVDAAGERRVLAVDFDKTTASYRLDPLDVRGFRPAVVYDGERWTLDFDNLHGVGNEELLKRMWDLPDMPLTTNQAEELLRLAGVDRDMLKEIWKGGPVPQWLNEMLQWQALKFELRQVHAASPMYTRPLSPLAEAVLCQALADVRNVDIQLLDETGDVAASYAPLFPHVRRLKAITVHRLQSGGYGATKAAPVSTTTPLGAAALTDVVLQLTAPNPGKTAPDPDAYRKKMQIALAVYFDTHGARIEEACVAVRGLGRSIGKENRYTHVVAPVLRDNGSGRETFAEQSLRAWYPGLSLQGARAVLADPVMGPIARSEPCANDIVDNVANLRDTLIANSARLRAVYGPYDATSETLLLTALTARPLWPADTAIQVVQGEFDSTGIGVTTRGHKVARYGSATATQTLVLVRVPDRTYRAQVVDANGITVLTSPDGSSPATSDSPRPSLYETVLEALPPGRRQCLVDARSLDASSAVADMTREIILAAAAVAAAQPRRSPEPDLAYHLAETEDPAMLDGIKPLDGVYRTGGSGYIKIENKVYRIDDKAANDHSRVALASSGESSARLIAWRDRNDRWKLRRIDSQTRRDIDAFQGPVPRFANPSLLSIPIDGIDVSGMPGAHPYRLRQGRHNHPVYYDVDIGRWFNSRIPGKSYVRVDDRWHEHSTAQAVSSPPKSYATIPLPAVPRPPVDTTPIPRMVHFGWVGDTMPGEHLLENVLASARLVADDLGNGWRIHLHVDVSDPAVLQQLRTQLEPAGVAVLDVGASPDFNRFLGSDVGKLYVAARDGAYPCYSAAMDMFRLAWILKHNGGGVYLDMDNRLIRKPVDLFAADNQLLFFEPMSNDELALSNGITNSIIGAHAESEMLDAVIAEAVRSSRLREGFFELPRPLPAPDDAFPHIKALAQQEMREYARAISHMAGPGMLNEFLDVYAPEYRQAAEASAQLSGRGFRHDEFSTAIQEALDAYFVMWRYVRVGSENSWRST